MGDTVSDFALPDQSGSTRQLSEFLATGPVVLFFYPAAMTFGCTKESCHFRDLGKEFAEIGAHRIGISADAVDKQKRFADKHGFDYPLLSDTDRVVADQFGVTSGFKLGPVRRVTFVIGTDAKVLGVIGSELRFATHGDQALDLLRRKAESPGGDSSS